MTMNKVVLKQIIKKKRAEMLLLKQRLDFLRNNNCLFDKSPYNPNQEVRQTRAEYLEKHAFLLKQVQDLEKKLIEISN